MLWQRFTKLQGQCDSEVKRLQELLDRMNNHYNPLSNSFDTATQYKDAAKKRYDALQKQIQDIENRLKQENDYNAEIEEENKQELNDISNVEKDIKTEKNIYDIAMKNLGSADQYKLAALTEHETLEEKVIPELNSDTRLAMMELHNSIKIQTDEIKNVIKSINKSTINVDKKTMNLKGTTSYANTILNVMFISYYVVYVIILYIVFNKQSIAFPYKLFMYVFFFLLPFFVGIYSVYFSNNIRVYLLTDRVYEFYISVTSFFNGIIGYILNILGINYIGTSIKNSLVK